MTEAYYHICDVLGGTYTLRILEGAADLLLALGPYLAASIARDPKNGAGDFNQARQLLLLK